MGVSAGSMSVAVGGAPLPVSMPLIHVDSPAHVHATRYEDGIPLSDDVAQVWVPDAAAAAAAGDEVMHVQAAEADTQARMRAQRVDEVAYSLHVATANATETQLVQQSRWIQEHHRVPGSIALTPSETVQALRVVKRAHDRRLGMMKATAQRIVDDAFKQGAALMIDEGMGPWHAWKKVLEDTRDGALPAAIDESADPTAFEYAVRHLRAVVRRQANRLLKTPLQSVDEFVPKLMVLVQTKVLSTADTALAQRVADALVNDVFDMSPRTLRGHGPKPLVGDAVDRATALRLINLANKVFATLPDTAQVTVAWFVALNVAFRFGTLLLRDFRYAVQRRRELLQRSQECECLHQSSLARRRALGDWGLAMKQFRAALPLEFAEAGYKTYFETVDDFIVMKWWNNQVWLNLGTREKDYLTESREQAIAADLQGFRPMKGPCPRRVDLFTVDLSAVLPPLCLPLGHPMAVHRLPEDAVDSLYDLCQKTGQAVLTVGDFCIAPDGTLFCVHFGGPPPNSTAAPSLQPPWLFQRDGSRTAAGALVQQLSMALYRLNQVFTAGSPRTEYADVLAALFAGLGSLDLFAGGFVPSRDQHHWFQAGAIVLDALLGLSSLVPNVEVLGLGVGKVQAMVESAVKAMNKGLQASGMRRLMDTLEEIPLLTMQISAPVLVLDVATKASSARDHPPSFAILFTELIGEEPAVPTMPFGNVVGHVLYSMDLFSAVFHKALLHRVASSSDTVAVFQVIVTDIGDGAFETYTMPMPKIVAEGYLQNHFDKTPVKNLRAALASTEADRILIITNFQRHSHLLIVTVSQCSCIHMDPHGSIGKEAHANVLQAWFYKELAQTWDGKIVFERVQSWCTIEGPQARLNMEHLRTNTTTGCDALGVTTDKYLQGSCMVWTHWFGCLLLCHAQLTPMQALQHFYTELEHRGWSVTLFLKHYLNDVIAYVRPYVVHDRADEKYCIGSKVLGYLVDCTRADYSKFELLKLILAVNSLEDAK